MAKVADQDSTITRLQGLLGEYRNALHDGEARQRLVEAWGVAETQFGVTEESPDWLNMYFDNRDLDLVYFAYSPEALLLAQKAEATR